VEVCQYKQVLELLLVQVLLEQVQQVEAVDTLTQATLYNHTS
jgi:hypothetical protein